MSNKHEKYMSRCLELAKKGLGSVSPNPMVGCVVVHNNSIIGEGYHEKFGGPHAEVNAINNLKDTSRIKESTIYINLEPCSFIGKTPACAQLIKEKGFSKVIVGCNDPNPKVSGKGLEIISNAGIEVESGILEKECISLNKRFFINQNEIRPYIILKFAQTDDGFIARTDFSSKWISGAESRKLVHKWRSEEDAILVGTNTAFYDNPSLTVRLCSGNNPIRVILDRSLRLPKNLKIFNDKKARTIIVHDKKSTPEEKEYIEYLAIDFSNKNWINNLYMVLYRKGIGSLFIEGGGMTLNNIIKSDLWDEARVFTSKSVFNAGIKAPIINKYGRPITSEYIQDDRLDIILRK